MIDSVKSDKYGFTIEGHINLKDDLTAREIYAKFIKRSWILIFQQL